MARVYIRIVAALFALAVLAVTVIGAYYVYRESWVPDRDKARAVHELMNTMAPKADPGRKRYDDAMELIRRGEFDGARVVLNEIMEVYKDSSRAPDARRVLGEMNMDRLFSRSPMPGKLEYTAARGDSLHAIAKKFRTTIAYIKRLNNLLGNVIHPEDHLVVYPLDFTVEVDLAGKRLTLLKDGRYFKDYSITGMHLPYKNVSAETAITDKPAWLGEKKVQPTDDQFTGAVKWLQTASRPSRPGIIFCPTPPEAAEGETKPATPGVYLAREDLEELSTIVRVGTPLRFLKKS